MTQKQNKLIFELTCHKLKAELAATAIEARLGQELMVKESEARVATATALAAAAAAATAATQRSAMAE